MRPRARLGYRLRALSVLGRRPLVCPEGHKVSFRRAAKSGRCRHGHPIWESA